MQHVGLQPLDLQTAEDLSRVPLLLREEVRRDLGYYVSIAELLSRNVHLDSSRTTAWRCPIYHDVRTLCLNGAHGARARSAYVGLLVRQWGYRQTRIVEPRGSVAYVELSWEHHALLPSGVRLKRQLLSPTADD